jgi:LysR family nitrogen assimilation transcriptional regulator
MVSRILCVSIARRYLEALPASSLKIVESFSGYIRESLSTGEFDVAISYMSDSIGETLWIEEFFLVGRRELAGRAASECPLGDLGKYPLILPGRPHGLRLLLDDCALRYRLKLQIILETDSLPTIIDLVSQGVGFAVLPVAAIYDLMAERQLSALRIIKPGLSRSVVMATSTQKPVSQSARALLDIIRDEARKFRSKSGLSTSVIAGL